MSEFDERVAKHAAEIRAALKVAKEEARKERMARESKTGDIGRIELPTEAVAARREAQQKRRARTLSDVVGDRRKERKAWERLLLLRSFRRKG